MKNCKKFFSVFLALLLCFGTFSGIATSAYAASSMALYMVEMPRGTDVNRTGWDAPAVSLMGGWKFAARKTHVLTPGSYNGPAVYCTEAGISAHSRNHGNNYQTQKQIFRCLLCRGRERRQASEMGKF